MIQRSSEISKKAEKAVESVARRMGAESISRPKNGADIEFRLGNRSYAVEVKVLSPYRAADLRGRVAEAYLRLRSHGAERGLLPAVAVALERLTNSAVGELTTFAARYLPDAGWIAVGLSDGRYRAHLGQQEVVGTLDAPPLHVEPSESQPSRDIFSARNARALKALLLSGIDARYFGRTNEADESPRSVQELARASGVAQSQVSALVRKLRDLDYLAPVPELRPRDTARLLEDWAFAARRRPIRHARPLFREESAQDCIRRVSLARSSRTGRRVIVGSFEACRLLGVAHATTRLVRLYSEDPPEALLRDLDLRESDRSDALFEIPLPKDYERVSFGDVLVPADGGQEVHATDALQCFLDVRFSPYRGAEQASFIYETILRPHFEKRGWV